MALEHRYGPNIHVADDPWLLSLLARIGSPETGTGAITDLVRTAYRRLCATALSGEFPVVEARIATRMAQVEQERGYYQGPILCPDTRLVVVAVLRGGILPAQVCYDVACQVLPPQNVRMDFLNMARKTGDDGQVTGVHFEGSRIGGPVADAVVLIPDPMGATGGTVGRALDIYKEMAGRARAYVCVHLMVTPEAIGRLGATHPEARMYAGRLDRGLSPDEVLQTVPGTHPERERGLNDVQYIVPGAGGIGELLTNSWV